MQKPSDKPATPPVGVLKTKRKSNISLPGKGTPLEITASASRRNTVTEETASKPRKKIKPPSTPTIPEDAATDETEAAFAVTNETRKINRNTSSASRISTVSGKTIKVAHTYDNKAYEGKVTESRNESIRTASRAPSVQSLETYQEQYCCCARRTKCERYLLVTVTVLVVIVIVLVIVIVVLAKQNKFKSLFKL